MYISIFFFQFLSIYSLLQDIEYRLNRHTDIENNLMATKGEGGGGINWEYGISRGTEPKNKLLIHFVV